MNKDKKHLEEEINYRLLKTFSQKNSQTQRELAIKFNISLGKINYCLTELVKKGFIKIENFKRSNNKAGYLYNLTPAGIEEKTRITYHFLKRKMTEYEGLEKEITELKSEVKGYGI